MKQRLLFVILSMVALSVTAILASATQVRSQEPIEVQPRQAAGDAQPQAPAAPTSLLFSYQGQLLNASGNPITNPATPMTFRLFTTPSGGTACWSESRTVDVRNGVFSVLLGQMTAINSACLAGDTYLELVVGGETLTPRERLTSVVHALEASTLPNGAVTQGNLNVSGNVLTAGSTSVPALSNAAKWVLTGNKPVSVNYGHNLTGAFGTTTQWDSDYMFTGLWDRGPNRKDAVIAWGDDPNDSLRFLHGIAAESAPREVMSWDTVDGLKVVGGLEVGLQDSGGGRLIIANNPNDNKIFIEAFSSDMSGSASELLLTGKWAGPMPQLSLVAENTSIKGNAEIHGNLDMHGYGRIGPNLPGPQHGRLEIIDGAIPLSFREAGQTGAGSLWRFVLDSRYLRFDASQNGNDFSSYTTPLAMFSDGLVSLSAVVTYGPMTVNGNTTINGNLHLNGSCSLSAASGSSEGANALVTNNNEDCTAGSITSGAYIEANLQTPEERRSERVDRFERGDLLCWSAEKDQLELCATANDRLVMAVADPNGRPIVIGAEPVKVLGPVQAGDILVSSDVPGYAMVNNDPKPGTVIGQALESFDGARALIKAMVRKW